jgi:DNA-binding GntR family transcriptional regulator
MGDKLSLRGPVTRPAPLRHIVFDALAELIINRDLEPGQHLREGVLAEQLGVSRQPVREAFQQLQAEGWIDLRPGQGAFVHAPTEKEADDLLAARTMLERESARLAAASRSDEDVARLWRIWERGKDAVAGGEVEEVVKANAEFHAFIVGMGDNLVLQELSQLVDRRVRWYHTPIAPHRGQESWDEHAAIIRAIAESDVERAGNLMAGHTERTRQAAHLGVKDA